MLRRVYASALIELTAAGDFWSEDQHEELERAVSDWLAICTDDRYAWLFRRRDAGWWDQEDRRSAALPPLEYQEYRREREVDRVVRGLLPLLNSKQQERAAVDHRASTNDHVHFFRGQLESIGLNWHLPRYRLIGGRLVIAQGRQHRVVNDLTLGFTRSWASTIVGLSVFVFQGDTWRVLRVLAGDPWRFWLSFVTLLAVTFAYLYAGIRRKVGLGNASLQRALVLQSIGQACAIAGAFLVTYLLMPAVFEMLQVNALPCYAPLLLAQLALFIGIFTQLLFDEKAATAPLDAP